MNVRACAHVCERVHARVRARVYSRVICELLCEGPSLQQILRHLNTVTRCEYPIIIGYYYYLLISIDIMQYHAVIDHRFTDQSRNELHHSFFSGNDS